jgi:uncharacterized protein YjlB
MKQAKDTIVRTFDAYGNFPNNPRLPLILYRQAIRLEEGDASAVESCFEQHDWGNSWRNGIYTYHHYHSTAHEVLGIYRGKAKVQLGGPEGLKVELSAGDVVIIPAGVAHKNLDASADFACVGAYPPGQNFDMNYGKEGERPQADKQIAQLALPDTDPVFGKDGLVLQEWQ